MSNRQLGWDEQLVRNGVSPREIDDQDREEFNEAEAQETPQRDKDRVLDSNPHTHSRQDKG